MSAFFYQYGGKEVEHLTRSDRHLAEFMRTVGYINTPVQADLFTSLAEILMRNQQEEEGIQVNYQKFNGLFNGTISPDAILLVEPQAIKASGLTWQTTDSLRNAAEAIAEGRLNVSKLKCLPDDEVIGRLTALNGISVGLAEMVMIVSMGRRDVVSYNNEKTRKGMMRLYGIKELTRSKFEYYRRRYSPYGSVASLYLWKFFDMPGSDRPMKTSPRSSADSLFAPSLRRVATSFRAYIPCRDFRPHSLPVGKNQ